MVEKIKSHIDTLSILNDRVELLNHKVDSVLKANSELSVQKSFFSDIISTQMQWFSIVFIITFGVLGLAYWLGIFKYFKSKFRTLDNNIKLTRNSLISRISQKDKESHSKISNNYSILENKIETLEKIQTEINNQRFTSVADEISKLENNISKIISNTETDIKEIILKQKEEFDIEKDELFKKLWETNFDTNRSMFFSCYNDKAYSAALTWIVPMLEMISNKQIVEYEIETFAATALICAENFVIDKTISERFDEFNDTLKSIEDRLEDTESKNTIKEVRTQLNKTYYTKLNLEKGTQQNGQPQTNA